MSLSDSFARFAKWTARTSGHPSAFGLDMSEEELERLRAHYYQLAERAQARLKQGGQKKGAPQVRRDGS